MKKRVVVIALALLFVAAAAFFAYERSDERLKAMLNDYEQKIESAETQIREQQSNLAWLEQKMAQAESEREKLSAEIEKKNEELESMGQQPAEEISKLLEELHQYEGKIEAIRGEQANAEADLSALRETVTSLQNEVSEAAKSSIPYGVKKEAERVVNEALSHEGTRVFRFLVSSDAHQNNDNKLITRSTIELGQAQAEILSLIGVDFVATLGDIAWGGDDDTAEEVKEQIIAYKRYTGYSLLGQTQLWCEGNHDDAVYSLKTYPENPKLSSSDTYGLLYSKNSEVVYDPEHYMEGYCYKDFPNQKVRVICLNTEQGTGDGAVMEEHQLKWFAEEALDMSGKSDWSVITIAHHPLDYGMASLFKDAVNIVDAFIKGESRVYTTSVGKTGINLDFNGKNCQYVGHFHGHTHGFSVVQMQKYTGKADNPYEKIDAWQLGIPNACYLRNNAQLTNTNPVANRFSTPVTYNKEDADGKRTSFNLVTICLDQNKIYLDNYGAGIDREVSYFEFTPAAN